MPSNNFENYQYKKDAMEKDIKRQSELEKAGFTVLRFTDDEVLKRLDLVRDEIGQCISKLEAKSPPPTPASGGQYS